MTQATLLSYFSPNPPSVSAPPIQTQESLSTAQDSRLASTSAPGSATQRPPIEDNESADNGSSQTRMTDLLRSPRSPNPHVKIARIQNCHLDSLKRLTSSTLPVRYPEKFFSETVSDPQAADLSRVILYEGCPIGWIRCRLESVDHSLANAVVNQIYIQALCLLAPYRHCGFATHLLHCLFEAETLTKYNASFVYAHVWENNEDALRWYENRGFRRTMLVEHYYRRLKPGGAWIVRLDIR
jgi:N-alpha-acetyltransferase 50